MVSRSGLLGFRQDSGRIGMHVFHCNSAFRDIGFRVVERAGCFH